MALEDLQNEIASWQRKFDEADRENDVLNAKIAQLEEAQEYLRSAKKAAQQLKSDIKGYEADAAWTGKRRGDLDSALTGTLASKMTTLIADIDATDDEVARYIKQYRADKNWFVELMSTAEDAIDGIRGKIEELIDGEG